MAPGSFWGIEQRVSGDASDQEAVDGDVPSIMPTPDRRERRGGFGGRCGTAAASRWPSERCAAGIEVSDGVWTDSVSLLADAGHMLTDAGSLASRSPPRASRPAARERRRSYGYGRTEVLAALANGLLLGGVSVGIAIESLERIASPHPVVAGPMVAVALAGLAANLASAQVLHGAAASSLNMRAAFWHVLGDALGSLVVVAAGTAILLWGWTGADTLGGVAIAGLLVASAFRLVRDSVEILLEGTPRHLDLEEIARKACALPGVSGVHDLHIWTVSSGFTAMSAHVDLQPGADAERVRFSVHRLLHENYAIEHTTIQTEAAPALLSIAESGSLESGEPLDCAGGSQRGRAAIPRLYAPPDTGSLDGEERPRSGQRRGREDSRRRPLSGEARQRPHHHRPALRTHAPLSHQGDLGRSRDLRRFPLRSESRFHHLSRATRRPGRPARP